MCSLRKRGGGKEGGAGGYLTYFSLVCLLIPPYYIYMSGNRSLFRNTDIVSFLAFMWRNLEESVILKFAM